jgi:hypothetical protein
MSNVANLVHNEVSKKWEGWFNGQLLISSPSQDYVVNNIRNGRCTKARNAGVTDISGEGMVQTAVSSPVVEVVQRFTINERFGFLEDFVEMVADDITPSLLVVGDGGLGKTHTVLATLRKNGFMDTYDLIADAKAPDAESSDEDESDEEEENLVISINDLLADSEVPVEKQYCMIKGYSTARGLYRSLYENRNRLVIFDDCDSILKDPTALNLLKGALDSYDRRVITWNSENPNSDLPRQFEFKGRIIFISNRKLFGIDQAVRSRAICVDLSMTTTQKIERMEEIIKTKGFMPEYDLKTKKQALSVLNEMKDETKDLNFRTLMAATRVAGKGGADWKRRVEYLLTAA